MDTMAGMYLTSKRNHEKGALFTHQWYTGHANRAGEMCAASEEFLAATDANRAFYSESSVWLHLDMCYAGKHIDCWKQIHDDGQQKVRKIYIFAWCRSDRKLDWGKVSHFYKRYQRAQSFGEQSAEWIADIKTHVDTYGFAYGHFNRNIKSSLVIKVNNSQDPAFKQVLKKCFLW